MSGLRANQAALALVSAVAPRSVVAATPGRVERSHADTSAEDGTPLAAFADKWADWIKMRLPAVVGAAVAVALTASARRAGETGSLVVSK